MHVYATHLAIFLLHLSDVYNVLYLSPIHCTKVIRLSYMYQCICHTFITHFEIFLPNSLRICQTCIHTPTSMSPSMQLLRVPCQRQWARVLAASSGWTAVADVRAPTSCGLRVTVGIRMGSSVRVMARVQFRHQV